MSSFSNSVCQRWKQDPKLNIPKTPLGVSGIIVELLKQNFRYNSRQFKYVDDAVNTQLQIELHQQWNPQTCSNFPGIYVKRNEWQLRADGKVMGDYHDLSMSTGYSFWTVARAMYTVICVGKEYGEVERLAEEAFNFLLMFHEPITTALKFHTFDVQGLSSVELIQEEKGLRSCTIPLLTIFDYGWKLTLEEPLLHDIELLTTP